MQDVHEIEQKPSPAIALINDLVHREETVENLIKALDKIGNLQAISIINKGLKNCHHYRTGQNFSNALFLVLTIMKYLILGIKNGTNYCKVLIENQ